MRSYTLDTADGDHVVTWKLPFSHYRGTRRITEAYWGEGNLECLKLCVTDKTPKPDGYTMVLFNQMLESNKHDLMATV